MDPLTRINATDFAFVTEIEWLTAFQKQDVVGTLAPSGVDVVPYIHRLVVTVGLCIIILAGILGNALVIVSVIISRNLRTTTNILVVNLAVTDLLTCATLPFQSVVLIDSNSQEYPLPEIVCVITAGSQHIFAPVSIASLSAIAFVRWYVITKSIRGHQGIHTPRRIALLVVIIWTVCIVLVAVPLLLGVGTFGYSTYYAICSVTDTNPLSFYFVLLLGAFILINLSLTGVFYALILKFVLNHSRQFRKKYEENSATSESGLHGETSYSRNAKSVIDRREVEITKNLFLVVCIFVVCWLPNCVNFTIPGRSLLTIYGALISMANSTVNPIIYGLRHPNFREAFAKILRCRR